MKLTSASGIYILLLLFPFFFQACSDDDNNDIISTVTITVAPDVEERVSFSPTEEGSRFTEYMKVKIGDNSQWQNMGFWEIDGFQYEDGYEYVLSVKKTELANPPQDASSVEYKLKKIVSKKKVNEDIIRINRYYTSAPHASVYGEISNEEKTEIKEKMLIPYPNSTARAQTYKFIYSDNTFTKGTVFVYLDTEKVEGTFEKKVVDDSDIYTLRFGEDTREINLRYYQHGTRTSLPSLPSFVEDLTEEYKVDYPALEEALVHLGIYASY